MADLYRNMVQDLLGAPGGRSALGSSVIPAFDTVPNLAAFGVGHFSIAGNIYYSDGSVSYQLTGVSPTITGLVSLSQIAARDLKNRTNPILGDYTLVSGVLTIDASTSDRFRIAVTEAITSIVIDLVPADDTEGWIADIEFVQDGTGHAISGWPSTIIWTSGFTPKISTLPNSVTRVALSTSDGAVSFSGWIYFSGPLRYTSFVAVIAPTDTAENTLVTIAVPPLNANDNAEFTFALTASGTGNKTYKFKFGATTVITFSDATATLIVMTITMGNRNSVSAQAWNALGKAGTNVVAQFATSAEDSSISKNFLLTAQKVTGADVVQLENYKFIVYKGQ